MLRNSRADSYLNEGSVVSQVCIQQDFMRGNHDSRQMKLGTWDVQDVAMWMVMEPSLKG